MGKSVRFGHAKSAVTADNFPRQERKVSKGFRNDGSNEMSPSSIGVGGVFTVALFDESPFAGDTYRVEEVSIQYQTETDKQGKPSGPITEETVIYLRPLYINEPPSSSPRVSNYLWSNLPRSYTRKVNGEVAERLTNF